MEALLGSLASWYGLFIVCLFLALAGIEAVRGRDGSAPRLAANLGCWLLGGWLVSRLPGTWTLAPGIEVTPFAWLGRDVGPGAVLVMGLAAVDLVSYASHRLHHGVHLLWRLHAVHHSDPVVDASTGLRHHPGEAIIVALLGGAVFGLLGLPAWALAAAATASLAWALVHHADLAWPAWLDRAAALLLVTPGLHRIHHSQEARHHGANFGTMFSLWDRLFGTYLPASSVPLTYGIGPAGAGSDRLPGALMLPLRLKPDLPATERVDA